LIPDRATIRGALHSADAAGRAPVHGDAPDGNDPRRAAVLVPLEAAADGWRVLLCIRTGHLPTHAGQISFPGGSLEGGEGPVDAALRETEEETGITRDFVEVAGALDRYLTVTGFVMSPVVGFLSPGFRLSPCPEEVSELFWMPLERAVDRSCYETRSLVYRGRRRHFYTQDYEGRQVWGATAAILVGFGDRLRAVGRDSADAL
jgi:8-oxo-dGTP pyrophosphatase MutT (NUDIX family)